MNRLLKSRDYLEKCLLFLLLFGFISLGSIGGCSDNNSGGQGITGATTALVEITLVNNCSETIWAITENISGNPRWELNEKGCTSNSDCENSNTNATCNNNTGNCEQIIQVSEGCSSCKIWPATGCDFESGFKCPAGIEEFCCATGGVLKPLSPVTVAEFTFQEQKTNPPENDFYDVSIIDGYNVAVEMFPKAEQGFLPIPNPGLTNYWCQNAGGPVFGSTNPNPDCVMNGDCEILNPKADCLWEDFFGTDCGGVPALRTVKPMFVTEATECPSGTKFKDVTIGNVCTCTDDSQCDSDQICGVGNSKTVPNKMCGELAGCENAKSLCGIGPYFEGGRGGDACGQENSCASTTCLTDPPKACGVTTPDCDSFPGAVCREGMCQCIPNVCNTEGKCTNDASSCSSTSDCPPTCDGTCTASPVDDLDCRGKFPRTVTCENTSDCPLLNGLKFAPGECSSCPDGTECVRLDPDGNIGCQMKCELNQVANIKMCRSLSCTKDSDCLTLDNIHPPKDTGIFMLCDTEDGSVTQNQCVATISSMLGGTGVNGQSCTNPTNFQGCSTDADCMNLPECNQPNANCKCGENKFCVIGNTNVGRYNAATTLCSGCTDPLDQIWVLEPSHPCTKKGEGKGDTTGDCDNVACTNEDWVNSIVPLISPFKLACPTTYVFPFDDTTATFQCRKPRRANLKYQITFCPPQPG
jgi:hypothetical protein